MAAVRIRRRSGGEGDAGLRVKVAVDEERPLVVR